MSLKISDIAQSLNLSKSTVSRSLPGKGRISYETREKVKSFAKNGNYITNSIAQSLVMSKSNTIAFLMTYAPMDDNAAFFRQCLSGVCKAASNMSYDVIVIDSDKNEETSLQRLIAKKKVDGVILNREPNESVDKVIKQFEVPYVLLGHSDDNNVNQIDTDKARAGEELVSKIIQKGGKI